MPPSSPSPRPTESELQILAVLWQRGPSTVRQVHEALGRETGYTSVLKLMQIMTAKGLLRRDGSQRTHVYATKPSEQHTQRQLVKDGYRIRIYIPYGRDWFAYFMRRLAERPANLVFFLRNILRS